MTMKSTINISVPIILTISLVLLLNTGISNTNGQIIGETNQTNQTQPQPVNQTQPQPVNQSSKQQDPQMIEKLLNYTNVGILALNDDDTSAAQDSLVQIQNALINASGKEVLVIPAPALQIDDDDENSD
jgi:hypothetical protein